MSKLKNVRHEKYCQNISLGMSQTESYIKAGYIARGNSAEVLSSKLLRNVKVANRIEELRQETQKEFKLTKNNILDKLKDVIISKSTDTPRTPDKLKAIEVVNKMCGFNEPDKLDVAVQSIKEIEDKIRKIAK